MFRRKSRDGDEQLVTNDTGDPVDRVSALRRLLADRRFEFRPIAQAWLDDPDPFVRREVSSQLLCYFTDHAEISSDVARIQIMAGEDPEAEVRSGAVRALSSYLKLAERERATILRTMVRVLEADEDPWVQQTCYEELLAHLAPDRRDEVPAAPTKFDRAQHVDWSLLASLRESN